MKCVVAVAVTFVALASASEPDVSHPVGRVIRMIQGLSAKVEMQHKNEALTYEKFVYWCKTSEKELNTAIALSKEEEATLTDSIDSKTQQEATLTDEINDLTDEIGAMQASAIAAKKVRDDTAGVYTSAMKDFTDTITAIGDAIKLLEASRPSLAQMLTMPSVRNALSLLSVASPNVAQRGAIASLLQGGASAAPAPAATNYSAKDRPDFLAKHGLEDHVQKYAFKSDNVIELLKELKLKFQDEQTATETAETNSLNAYALSKQALDAAEKAAEGSKKAKTTLRGEVQADLIQLKSDLKSAKADLAADTATLETTTASCIMKKEEWDERTATQEQEREAMAMAIKILAKVSGVRTEAPENPVPPPAPTGFLNVGGPASFLQVLNQSPAEKVMSLLRSTSSATHSKALARLADQIAMDPGSSHDGGHFGAVINSIEKMIFKLQDEQMAENKQRDWCRKELSETETSKSDKESKIRELTLKIDADDALVLKLTSDITAAEAMVADIVGFMKEATDIRRDGKAENDKALKDAEDAQTAIAEATAVLEAFYKESGMIEKEAWEFVQQPVTLSAEPATWGASYTGISDPKHNPRGIVEVLKAVAADFAKMEAETRAQDSTDQKEYDDQMSKSTIDKARRAKEAEMKTNEKKGIMDRMSAMQKRRKNVEGELESVEQYLKDLAPACITGSSTYKDREAARDQEIAALHEAQAILTDAFKATPPTFLAIRRH